MLDSLSSTVIHCSSFTTVLPCRSRSAYQTILDRMLPWGPCTGTAVEGFVGHGCGREWGVPVIGVCKGAGHGRGWFGRLSSGQGVEGDRVLLQWNRCGKGWCVPGEGVWQGIRCGMGLGVARDGLWQGRGPFSYPPKLIAPSKSLVGRDYSFHEGMHLNGQG